MQHRLGDLQAPDHPAGIGVDQLVRRVRQAHEREPVANASFAQRARDVVEFGEYPEILVTGKLAVGRQYLRHVTDYATNIRSLADNVVTCHGGAAGSRPQQSRQHF